MSLFALLGSQGIVVKCTAAIFFRTVDYKARARKKKTKFAQELQNYYLHLS